jgi:hypothetical protein
MDFPIPYSQAKALILRSDTLRQLLTERRAFRSSRCGDWRYRTSAARKIILALSGYPLFLLGR